MNITFRDKKFSKLVNDYRKLQAAKGAKQAKKITQRLGDLSAAETLEDTRHLPGNYHEFRNKRKGQWACSLDDPYRLVFTPHEDPIPEDDNGSHIWSEIRGIVYNPAMLTPLFRFVLTPPFRSIDPLIGDKM